MFRLFWCAIKSIPAIAVGSLLVTNASFAQAKPKVNFVDQSFSKTKQYQHSALDSHYQINNFDQLDILSANWAYRELSSVADRYSCNTSINNQGNRVLSRYEFATDLYFCLNQIKELFAASGTILEEDVEIISRLTEEFKDELMALSNRVDDQENHTALFQDATIFAIAEIIDDAENSNNDIAKTTFGEDSYDSLNPASRFISKNALPSRLSLGDISRIESEDLITDATGIEIDTKNDKNYEVKARYYNFPFLDERFTGYVGNTNLGAYDLFDVNNPVLASKSTASVSRFIHSNPILFLGTDGIGAGLSTKIGTAKITGLYLTNGSAEDPSSGEGIFSSSYTTGAQIGVSPTANLDIALTYVYEYLNGVGVDLTGDIGSDIAKRPFGKANTRAHQVGLGANYTLKEKVVFSATSGLSLASEIGANNNATLYTTAITVSILDAGKGGAIFSLAGGIPPILINNDKGVEDKDMSFLIEAQYQYPVGKNMTITPGAFVVINSESNSDNGTEVAGILRTSFKF